MYMLPFGTDKSIREIKQLVTSWWYYHVVVIVLNIAGVLGIPLLSNYMRNYDLLCWHKNK